MLEGYSDDFTKLGYVCIYELEDKGYKEFMKSNRLLYYFEGEVMAAECRSCGSVKFSNRFSLDVSEDSGISRECKACYSYRRRSWGSYIEQDYTNRRRARKQNLPDTEKPEQRLAVWNHFSNACALTGSPENLAADHVIPINAGHGGTIYGNMIPLSSALNSSKSDKHIFEWFELNRKRFGLSQRKFDSLIDYLADLNDMTTQEYRDYVDWCFDNPRKYDEDLGELVFVNN